MADVPDPRLDAIADAQDIPPPRAGPGAAGGHRRPGRRRRHRRGPRRRRPRAAAPGRRPRARGARLRQRRGAAPRGARRPPRRRRGRRPGAGRRRPRAGRAPPGARAQGRPRRRGRARRAELAALEVLAAELDAGRPARLAARRGRPRRRRRDGPAHRQAGALPREHRRGPDAARRASPPTPRPRAPRRSPCRWGWSWSWRRWSRRRPPSWPRELELGDIRGADAVVAAAYRLLDLVTFFTGSGPPEARAWPIAPRHDRRRRRRADPLRHGARVHPRRGHPVGRPGGGRARGQQGPRERDRCGWRGADYVVQEGDVLQIRFNV